MKSTELIISVFTNVFSVEVFLVILIALVGWLIFQKKYTAALLIVVWLGVLFASIILSKDFFAVSRPENALIMLDSYAFPSGHSASVAFLSAVLGWFGIVIKRYNRMITWLALGGIVLLVGYSRHNRASAGRLCAWVFNWQLFLHKRTHHKSVGCPFSFV